MKVKRGDRRPGATITCKDGAALVDLTAADSMRLIGKMDGASGFPLIDRPITGNAAGEVVIDSWEVGDTATVGTLHLEVEVTWGDGAPQTFPVDGFLCVQIVPDLG